MHTTRHADLMNVKMNMEWTPLELEVNTAAPLNPPCPALPFPAPMLPGVVSAVRPLVGVDDGHELDAIDPGSRGMPVLHSCSAYVAVATAAPFWSTDRVSIGRGKSMAGKS